MPCLHSSRMWRRVRGRVGVVAWLLGGMVECGGRDSNPGISGGKAEKPMQNPLKYFANEFIHAASALDWLRERVIKRGLRLSLVFDAQLRLGGERDVGMGVLVDLPKREVRIRKRRGQRGNTIVLPLSRKNVEWIEERVREGAALAFAAAWVGRSRRNGAVALHVALTFRREVTQMTPKRVLVVDLNALRNGVVWAVVEEKRVLRRGVLRPHIAKIERLQRQIARLDSLCARKDRVCQHAASVKSRLWRLLRQWGMMRQGRSWNSPPDLKPR